MPKNTDICKECGNEYSMHSTDSARCPKNGGWPIGGGELDFFSTHFDDGLYGVDQLRARIATLEAENARLTAANESMQEDAVQNTYAFGLMLKANKEQTEEIRTLKQALTDIRATTVTLGDSQSAWKAWRKCSEIASDVLK